MSWHNCWAAAGGKADSLETPLSSNTSLSTLTALHQGFASHVTPHSSHALPSHFSFLVLHTLSLTLPHSLASCQLLAMQVPLVCHQHVPQVLH